MSTERPKYDPDELAAEGLTEEEAEDLRKAFDEVDHGEAIPGDQVFDELHAELEALIKVRERRAG